ncbi:unnamed protein product [Phytophthora lilii]|uniref:Unnamed protein product n=1 Tax=Phytophthora lilii TaxID=2077276 RepID=A0A9W6WHI8_9STRA|nr:unnamed protein product [Phytophthora lilii]
MATLTGMCSSLVAGSAAVGHPTYAAAAGYQRESSRSVPEAGEQTPCGQPQQGELSLWSVFTDGKCSLQTQGVCTA